MLDFLRRKIFRTDVSTTDIEIVAGPRLRQNWNLKWRRGGKAVLTVPATVLQAPPEITDAMRQWAELVIHKSRGLHAVEAKIVRGELEKNIRGWIEAHHAKDPRKRELASRLAARKLERLNAVGRHHNLAEILARVNSEYFEGRLKVRITWSRRWGGLSTQSTRRDAEGRSYPLITISRGYDHPSATAEIVGGVVYHECLHIVLPPSEANGRRVVHGRDFRRLEKEYRHYEMWRSWHRHMLPKILRHPL